MLGEAGSAPPVEGSTNDRRNPLVALPLPVAELVEGLDGVLVTHTHSDHLDPAADEAFPHGLPLLCQPPDEQALRERGFADVRPVTGELDWDGLRVAVHMEAINHCLLTRADLRADLEAEGLGGRVLVPEDGQQPAI